MSLPSQAQAKQRSHTVVKLASEIARPDADSPNGAHEHNPSIPIALKATKATEVSALEPLVANVASVAWFVG